MEKWYESESERQNINGKQGKNIESGDPQKDFKESRKILVPTTYETDNLNLRRNSTSDRTDRLLILGDFGRFQRVSPFSWGILSFPCKSPQMGRNLNLSPESPLFPRFGSHSPLFSTNSLLLRSLFVRRMRTSQRGGFSLRRSDSPVFLSVLSMIGIKIIQS